MPVEANLHTKADFAKVLDLDFVDQFNLRLTSFFSLLGLYRKIPMQAGALIKTYGATTTLAGGVVEPGEIIPLSKVVTKVVETKELEFDKRRKAVPAEVIQQVGYQQACINTDTKFLNEIQKIIRDKFITGLGKGKGKARGTNLQEALANGWAGVTTVFSEDDVNVVSFVNPQDIADYLGKAQITIQTVFGMNYIQDFLNNRVVFIHPSIPAKTVYSTAVDNLVLAYADVNGDLNKAFDFVTDQSGIIGVTHDIDKQRLTAETITLFALHLFAENINGVIVTTIAPGA